MNPGVIESEDWNFDAVPEPELVACCYWEYARESAFICNLRERILKHWMPRFQKPRWWNEPEAEDIHRDTEKVRSIGYPAESFACPPDGVLPDALPLKPGEVHRLTGSFPKPWQLLTKEEREYRAHTPPKGLVDFVQREPFDRGLSLDAQAIVQDVAARQRRCQKANERARRENPKLPEGALKRLGKFQSPDMKPSVICARGLEQTVVQINWGLFSNEEIIQSFRKWVKANRPDDAPFSDTKGRNKARDWRVALERLGMMRLLHQWSLRELPKAAPAAWNLYAKREWYKERKRAGEMFHRLFPFLSKSERPLNWPTKGGHSK
jgi:hypothetical protein